MDRSHVLALALALATLGGLHGGARAQDAQARDADTEARDAEARSLYDAGVAAYADARYEDALARWREAHRLSGRPELLYNMAQACDRLRRDSDALGYLEEYLRELPDAPNRREVEVRIATLRDAIARAQPAPPLEPEPQPVPAAPTVDPTVGWVLVGAGAAVAIAGAIMLGVGVGDASTIENAPVGSSWSDHAGAYDRAPVLTAAGGAALGIGVAAAGAGAIVLAMSGAAPQESVRVSFGLGSIAVRGTF